MKKIFVTIPWFHPAFKAGGPIQSIANLVNEFEKHKNYKFYIFCGNTDLNDTTLENIETGKWIRYNTQTAVWYADPSRRSDTLVKLTEKVKPDIIYIIGIFSWHFNMVPLLFCKAPRKIVSVRGMLHPGALLEKKVKKKLFLGLWKFFNWHKKVVFHATDYLEKTYIEKLFGDEITIFTATNFPRKFGAELLEKKPGRLKMVSVALISPMKNHLLVLEAFEHTPAIIEYHICGPVKDMEYWQKCLEQMKQLPVNIAVEYHGEVAPPWVPTMLQKGHVFVQLSKSENFGHAIYEALSAGKPVITSHHTPWQDLKEKKAGMNVDLDVRSVSEAILFFESMDQDEYAIWSQGAKDYAATALDFSSIRLQYELMFTVPVAEEITS